MKKKMIMSQAIINFMLSLVPGTVKEKSIKNENKSLLKHARKRVTDYEQIKKMKEMFSDEMAREWSEEEKTIAWSDGNEKTGKLVSYSTIPGFTCIDRSREMDGEEALPKCFTDGNCYAIKDCIYPDVQRSAVHNTVLILKYPEHFKKSMYERLSDPNVIGMRPHIEGDYVNVFELHTVNQCAGDTGTIVMGYTKKYNMINRYLDEGNTLNMILIFSAWNGMFMRNPHRLPVCIVAETVADYNKLRKQYKGKIRLCGDLCRNDDGTWHFVTGNCTKCLIHHLFNDGLGGCFDMGKDMIVLMLAH